MRGLRLMATAEAAVKIKLEPKYIYVSLTLCLTMSGQSLKEVNLYYEHQSIEISHYFLVKEM